MPFRKLIENASFEPEALDVIYQAFDAAWDEIASHVGSDPTAIALAKERLALAVFRASQADASDPVRIRTEAVAAFLSSDPTKD